MKELNWLQRLVDGVRWRIIHVFDKSHKNYPTRAYDEDREHD